MPLRDATSSWPISSPISSFRRQLKFRKPTRLHWIMPIYDEMFFRCLQLTFNFLENRLPTFPLIFPETTLDAPNFHFYFFCASKMRFSCLDFIFFLSMFNILFISSLVSSDDASLVLFCLSLTKKVLCFSLLRIES